MATDVDAVYENGKNDKKPNDMICNRPFLSRVQIRNYKSIGSCDVRLRPLSILVGRNGSGKSNFLDALRFVMEGLQTSLDHAIKSRGGIDEVRRRSTGHPRNFALKLHLNLPDRRVASYGFEIAARPQGGFFVKKEELICPGYGYRVVEGQVCGFKSTGNNAIGESCHDNNEKLFSGENALPPASADRLYLVNAAGLPRFRPVYDGLLNMGFYNLNPETMKKPQSPDAGELLHRDGANIASVMARLAEEKPEIKQRIELYLSTIVPGIVDVNRIPVGSWETIEFRQEVVGAKHPWRFYAASMSDGTLRALGALVAVAQLAGRTSPVSLVGIEEPETALHAAAAGAMMDALREAACHTQVIVTTHSPDLLDQVQFESDMLLVVHSRRGNTEIGPVDEASREAIKAHLYSAGDLLRMDQLEIHPEAQAQQANLDFEFEGANS